nr:hypothetical protein [Tanacetum cinerariifolium]
NIENKDSYDSNLDELDLLVTPLFDANEDECFDPGGDIDEIDAFLEIDVSTNIKDGYYDSERDIIYLENLLTYDTIPSLLSEMFLDHDPKGLKDEPNNDDLKYMIKIFDPKIHEEIFSLTYVMSTLLRSLPLLKTLHCCMKIRSTQSQRCVFVIFIMYSVYIPLI